MGIGGIVADERLCGLEECSQRLQIGSIQEMDVNFGARSNGIQEREISRTFYPLDLPAGRVKVTGKFKEVTHRPGAVHGTAHTRREQDQVPWLRPREEAKARLRVFREGQTGGAEQASEARALRFLDVEWNFAMKDRSMSGKKIARRIHGNLPRRGGRCSEPHGASEAATVTSATQVRLPTAATAMSHGRAPTKVVHHASRSSVEEFHSANGARSNGSRTRPVGCSRSSRSASASGAAERTG
jgi:hypothetical protein